MVEAYGEEKEIGSGGEEDGWDEEDDWGDCGQEEDYTGMMEMEENKLEKATSSGLGIEKVFMAGHMKNKYYNIIDSNRINVE